MLPEVHVSAWPGCDEASHPQSALVSTPRGAPAPSDPGGADLWGAMPRNQREGRYSLLGSLPAGPPSPNRSQGLSEQSCHTLLLVPTPSSRPSLPKEPPPQHTCC